MTDGQVGRNCQQVQHEDKCSEDKTMVVSRDEGQMVNITIDRQEVEQVKNFKYFGSNISEDGYNVADVKSGIALANEAFNKRKSF